MDLGFTLFVMTAAILMAIGGALVLVAHLGIVPASFNFGWRQWLPTLLLPVFGPLWFAHHHAPEFRPPYLQLLAGMLLLGLAGAMLAGFGPYYAERLLAGVK